MKQASKWGRVRFGTVARPRSDVGRREIGPDPIRGAAMSAADLARSADAVEAAIARVLDAEHAAREAVEQAEERRRR